MAELTNFCQKSDSSAADAAEKWLKLFVDGPEELHDFLEYRCDKSNVFKTWEKIKRNKLKTTFSKNLKLMDSSHAACSQKTKERSAF